MSGTSCGTCVLHLAPGGHVGGPLAPVRDGDPTQPDLLVEGAEPARRRAAWTPPPPPPPRYARGWTAPHLAHVRQADGGCGFDVLEHGVPEPEIHGSAASTAMQETNP